MSGSLSGLVYAGELYATSNGQGNDTKSNISIYLPLNIKPDGSFQQTGPFRNSGGGATSTLSSGDIPPGLYITASGSESGGARWAVLKPYDGSDILVATKFSKTYEPIQFKVTFGLYSDPGEAFGAGGANIKVEVYYKPLAGSSVLRQRFEAYHTVSDRPVSHGPTDDVGPKATVASA